MNEQDHAVAADGTKFCLQTERVRGEPAWHSVLRWDGGRQWVAVRGSGSHRKSTARAQMRRAAREWKGSADG